VDQVVGRGDAGQRPVDAVAGHDVGRDDLDAVGPGQTAQLVRLPDQAADAVSPGEQLGDEPASDVPGRAGDEHGHAKVV
jgi:hypothetical protein